MTRLTGEVADGFFTHSCNSDPRAIRELAIPAVEAGAKRGGRSLDDVDIMVSPYMNTGSTAEEIAEVRDANRRQMADHVLDSELLGSAAPARHRGDSALQLRELTRANRWDELADLLSDDLVDEIAITGDYIDSAHLLKERYGDLPDLAALPAAGRPRRRRPDREGARDPAGLT